jgi:hypothetical protein
MFYMKVNKMFTAVANQYGFLSIFLFYIGNAVSLTRRLRNFCGISYGIKLLVMHKIC